MYLMCVHACQVASVLFDSFATPWTVAARLLCPWDSPGKNTGVGLPGDLPNPGIELKSRVSCFGRWVLYHECHLGSPYLT